MAILNIGNRTTIRFNSPMPVENIRTAMQHSYVEKFIDPASFPDGKTHVQTITLVESPGLDSHAMKCLSTFMHRMDISLSNARTAHAGSQPGSHPNQSGSWTL